MREKRSCLTFVLCFVLLFTSQVWAAQKSGVAATQSDKIPQSGGTIPVYELSNVTIESPAASPYQVYHNKTVSFIAKTTIPSTVTSVAGWEMTIEFKQLPTPGQYLPIVVPLKTAPLTPAGYVNMSVDLAIGKWEVRARITKPKVGAWTDWRAFEITSPNDYCAFYPSQPLPPEYYKWQAGATMPLQIKVQNCGSKGWSIFSPAPAGALESVKLTYWVTSGQPTGVAAVPLVQTDVLVPSGGTATFNGTFVVPTVKGNYTITWDMRQDNTPFSTKGVAQGHWYFTVE